MDFVIWTSLLAVGLSLARAVGLCGCRGFTLWGADRVPLKKKKSYNLLLNFFVGAAAPIIINMALPLLAVSKLACRLTLHTTLM